MREKIALLFLLMLFTVSLAGASQGHWLHVRVNEAGEDGEKVSVNLPVSLIDAVLSNLDIDEFHNGTIRIDDAEFDREMVEAIYEAAKDAKNGVFVEIEDGEESVLVVKKGDEIHVNITDYDEEIKVRIPLKVVGALLSNSNDDELNISAALRELAESGNNTLVTVEGDDESIRVWVDDSMEGI